MRHPFVYPVVYPVFTLVLLLGLSVPAAWAAPPADIQTEARNSFIFTFSASVADEDIGTLASSLTSSYHGTLRHVFRNTLHGFSTTMARTEAEKLLDENSEVSALVNNGVGHAPGIDPGALASAGAKGGKGKPPGKTEQQVQSWGVAVVGGSQDATADGTPRHAWIIDTGIDDYYDGSELNIGDGENFVAKGQDTTDDTTGHGTHIAGIIAAIDNDTGVLGIAAGATVHPVRVLHKNRWGTVDDIISGVDYVAGKIADYPNAVHVVNMSLTVEIDGQKAVADLLDDAVTTLASSGVPFAVCAGNDSTDVSRYSPAHLSLPNVYTVASVDEDGNLASDSNYGPEIDYVAPGVTIESLKPGGGTWFWSGCSMATAHVTGILLFQTPEGIDIGAGYDLAHF
jgi:subtilisin family serine protease